MRLDLYMAQEAINQATGRYNAAIGRGLRLLEQRTTFRKNTAEDVSEHRYQDMAFRIFRNDALQKYSAQFDLAPRYVFLAAKAYDYETNLLGDQTGSARSILSDIVEARSIGTIQNGSPLVGGGLAGFLARLNLNWENFEGLLGVNSRFDNDFRLRWELFRIPRTLSYDADWRAIIEQHVVDDVNLIPEYRQFAQLPQTPLPEPAIVIPFATTVHNGLNFFGWPSTGDSSVPFDRFAIKLMSLEIRFSNYPGIGAGLDEPVFVFLIPTGADVMRVPPVCDSPAATRVREWHLIDQTLPPLGELSLSQLQTNPNWLPWHTLGDTPQLGAQALVTRRRIPTLSACAAESLSCVESFKLTGRSIWNTRWILIIPENSLAGKEGVNGIERFIHGLSGTGVRDIILKFKSYGYDACVSGGGVAAQTEPFSAVDAPEGATMALPE